MTPIWHTSQPSLVERRGGGTTKHVSLTDILFPCWRCPTVIVAAPGRAWLYNCNHIQLNFQFRPLLIRPVIREADTEHFLQRPVKGVVSVDHILGECFSVSQYLEINYRVGVSSVTLSSFFLLQFHFLVVWWTVCFKFTEIVFKKVDCFEVFKYYYFICQRQELGWIA